MEIINAMDLTNAHWYLAMLCGALIGMAKTGLNALGLFVVVIMASLFGGKASAGITLPLLCVADVIAVFYYRRHADLELVVRLMPWVLAGITAGLFFGNLISDQAFKITIGVIVLFCIGLMIWLNSRHQNSELSQYRWLAVPAGIIGGFSTMMGNAAGPIITVYLLSMNLQKNQLIGTGAWFFMIINLIKLPLHFFFWQTISAQTLIFNAILVPAIIFGGFTGIFLVKKIPNNAYTIFIMVSTVISAAWLIFKNV